MKIHTLAELQEPDELVRRLTPLGLSTAGMLAPEAAAEYQQLLVAPAELVDRVPEGTRASFDRLRTLHAYGILCYDTFTTVVDLAPRVADLALRERFVAHFDGSFLASARDETEQQIVANSVSQLVQRLRAGRLRLRDWPAHERFDGGFGQLLRWARRADLLSGQRARHAETRLRNWRNMLTHPDSSHLLMPGHSARDICDLAEIINRLWGSRTPGGRLYPAPVEREILTLAYQEGGSHSVGRADALGYHPSLVDAMVIIVRGVRDDEGLFNFDSMFEHTHLPADFLWGPGTYADAIAWVTEHGPETDFVDHLDRCFLLRRTEASVGPPRNPKVAAGLPDSERSGKWYAVRADFPGDAFIHVQGDHDPFTGPCAICAADGQATGSLGEVLAAIQKSGVDVTPVFPAPARMPGLWP